MRASSQLWKTLSAARSVFERPRSNILSVWCGASLNGYGDNFQGSKQFLLYNLTFTQQNEHRDWLILGHVPLIKFKCIPTGIQLRSCCPHAVFVCLFLLYDRLNIKQNTQCMVPRGTS